MEDVQKCPRNHRPPRLCGSWLDFEFIRECMKINKIRPKFHFLTRLAIKMTHLVVLFCYLKLSLCFQSHLEAVFLTFKILSCTDNKMGTLASLKRTVPTRSSINPLKIVLPLQNCSYDNLSFPTVLLESQVSSQPPAKRLILNLFYQRFLSRNAYDQTS